MQEGPLAVVANRRRSATKRLQYIRRGIRKTVRLAVVRALLSDALGSISRAIEPPLSGVPLLKGSRPVRLPCFHFTFSSGPALADLQPVVQHWVKCAPWPLIFHQSARLGIY